MNGISLFACLNWLSALQNLEYADIGLFALSITSGIHCRSQERHLLGMRIFSGATASRLLHLHWKVTDLISPRPTTILFSTIIPAAYAFYSSGRNSPVTAPPFYGKKSVMYISAQISCPPAVNAILSLRPWSLFCGPVFRAARAQAKDLGFRQRTDERLPSH